MIGHYLIGGAMLLVAVMVLATMYSLKDLKEARDFETSKLRFAAVTFTGIMTLILFTSVLAISDSSESGMDIFKTVMTGLSPIAGGIVGYLFAAKEK